MQQSLAARASVYNYTAGCYQDKLDTNLHASLMNPDSIMSNIEAFNRSDASISKDKSYSALINQ